MVMMRTSLSEYEGTDGSNRQACLRRYDREQYHGGIGMPRAIRREELLRKRRRRNSLTVVAKRHHQQRDFQHQHARTWQC